MKILLKDNLILWLEYKDVKIGKEKIIKFLKLHFQDNEDYKILNINEEKRGAHNKQYITVSPDCFKELCMHVGIN